MSKHVSEFLNKKVISITGGQTGDDEIHIELEDGTTIYCYHEQDCCESVEIVDIDGDIQDLVGGYLNQLEMVTNSDDPMDKDPKWLDSFTWSFLKIGTSKGTLVIRWLGESNGYYSERVDVSYDKKGWRNRIEGVEL